MQTYTNPLRLQAGTTDCNFAGDKLRSTPSSAGKLSSQGVRHDRRRVVTRASAAALGRALDGIKTKPGRYYADQFCDIPSRINCTPDKEGDHLLYLYQEKIVTGIITAFWHIEHSTPDRVLLRAEMKVPGRAYLEFRIRRTDDGKRALEQNAYYLPDSFWGYLYWYAMLPFHFFIFGNMAKRIVTWAEKQDAALEERIITSALPPANMAHK